MIELNTKISGHIVMRTVGKDGKERERREFRNLITNVGMDGLGAESAVALSDYCGMGTGSSPVLEGQTDLITPAGARDNTLVAASTVENNNGGAGGVWYAYKIREFEFIPNHFGGAVNLAEVGFFSASTAGIMFSRALIKDGNGDPTTIQVLADEYLYVTYELRVYPPMTDATGTIDISGVAYNYTVRAANVDAVTAWSPDNLMPFGTDGRCMATQTLGAVTDYPAGTTYSSSSDSLSTYVNGNYYRDVTHTWSPTVGNTGSGVGSVAFASGSTTTINGYAQFQASFSAVTGGGTIPKDATKTLSLTFRVSWARHV